MLHFIVIVAIFQVSEPLDAPFHSYSSHIPSSEPLDAPFHSYSSHIPSF